MFGVKPKNLPRLMSWSLQSIFSSRSSMVSRLPLKSFIPFELISGFGVRQWFSLMLCCHIFPAPLIEETSLSPWCTLAFYVKNFKVLLIFLLSTSTLLTIMAPEKNNPRTLPPLPLDLANLAPWCYKNNVMLMCPTPV